MVSIVDDVTRHMRTSLECGKLHVDPILCEEYLSQQMVL